MESGTSKIFLFIENNPFFDSSARGNRYASLLNGLIKCGANISVYVVGGYNTVQEIDYFRNNKYFNGIPITYLTIIPNHTLFWKRINKYLLFPIIKWHLIYKMNKIMRMRAYDYWWLTINNSVLEFYNRHSSSIKNSLIELNEFQDVLIKKENITHRIQVKHAYQLYNNLLTAIGSIDYFACMTETLLNNYKQMAKRQAKFIHLPMTVDLSRFDVEVKCKYSYIAYAGSLSNDKDGIDILIKSFAYIAKKYPDIKLCLAGPNHPDVAKQKKLISDFNLENRIIYLGTLIRDEIPQFLKGATLLALARPDSHQAQGGFPTKLGEYLATKNPVCVTTVGEIGNYLKDNTSAYLAVPGSVESFARALQRAMDDHNRAQIGHAGYLVAYNNFNMEVQAARLKTFLDTNNKIQMMR